MKNYSKILTTALLTTSLSALMTFANFIASYIVRTQADNGQTYNSTGYFGQTNSPDASSAKGLEDTLAPPAPPIGSRTVGETQPDYQTVQKNIYGTNDLVIFHNYIEDNNITATNRTIDFDDLPLGDWALRRFSDTLYTDRIKPDLTITDGETYDLGTNTQSFTIFERPQRTGFSVQPNSSNPSNTDLTIIADYYSGLPSTHDMKIHTTSDITSTNWIDSETMTKSGENIYTGTASNLQGNANYAKIVIEEKP